MTTTDPVPLTEPSGGVPVPVVTPEGLLVTAVALAAGRGPVAVDAERASGYRYGQRAYLVQLRREGAGTFVVDPVGVPDLSPLGDALADTEWVLHAASQDLPCLREVGMRPGTLFDTELAGRLLGLPRVGLGAMVEEVLGLALAKEHSSVDWSTRPLPEPWLRYAALDVEVLVELRDRLEERLVAAGKLAWAREEFAAAAAAPGPAPRVDPWRRTSGLHRARRRRQVAVVRELWGERESLARELDTAPGRVLPDSTIVEVALAAPASQAEMLALPSFRGRGARRRAAQWYAPVARALALAEGELPPMSVTPEGPPPVRSWPERDPVAAARLVGARASVAELAERLRMPTENLLTPDLLRRVVWSPPGEHAGTEEVAEALAAMGARPWQVQLTAPLLAAALRDLPAPVAPEPDAPQSDALEPDAPAAPAGEGVS